MDGGVDDGVAELGLEPLAEPEPDEPDDPEVSDEAPELPDDEPGDEPYVEESDALGMVQAVNANAQATGMIHLCM